MIRRLRQHSKLFLKRVAAAAFARLSSKVWGWNRVCPYLAGLYYLLDGSFLWEQRAVLLASRRHGDSCSTSLYSFRRGIHRLEKGAINRPRKRIYAEDYIAETVKTFGELVKEYEAGTLGFAEDIKWGHSTLSEYFAFTRGSNIIDSARQEFVELTGPHQWRVNEPAPAQHLDVTQYAFDVQDLLVVAQSRHSIRCYLHEPVPRETIDAAVAVALESPSACNRQAFSFRIFDDPTLVRRIAEIPMGIDGEGSGIPLLVVIVGNLGAYPEPRDRHLIYIDASLAAMAFVFALQVQGIGTCCINWPEIGRFEERMQKVIGLSAFERPVILISAGYPNPEGAVPSSQKRIMQEMRIYNSVTLPI